MNSTVWLVVHAAASELQHVPSFFRCAPCVITRVGVDPQFPPLHGIAVLIVDCTIPQFLPLHGIALLRMELCPVFLLLQFSTWNSPPFLIRRIDARPRGRARVVRCSIPSFVDATTTWKWRWWAQVRLVWP